MHRQLYCRTQELTRKAKILRVACGESQYSMPASAGASDFEEFTVLQKWCPGTKRAFFRSLPDSGIVKAWRYGAPEHASAEAEEEVSKEQQW
jgi:hypothetical protein